MRSELRVRMRTLGEQHPTKSQRRLLDYFKTADLRRIAGCPITELARQTDVSVATVIRFCHALGYVGYQEFRLALAQEESQEREGGCVAALRSKYRETIELCTVSEYALASACEIVRGARAVCCYGEGGSRFTALALHSRLIGMGVPVLFADDFLLTCSLLATRGDGDVLILFAGQTCTRDMTEIAALAKAQGMKVIVAGNARSPLLQHSDLILSSASAIYEEENCIAEMFIVDAILLALRRTASEDVRASLRIAAVRSGEN